MKSINKYLNQAEIFFGRTHLFSLPRWVQIEPTNMCNQRCMMCPRNSGLDSPLGEMSLESFIKIYKQIPTIENIQLNGLGEPLINPDIFEMIKYAKSRESSVTLTSNCELADEVKARKLVESGLDLLKVSMDSADANNYYSIRHGDLHRALEGIKNIVVAKRRNGTTKPMIWFNSIIMKDNCDKMGDIIKLGELAGVDFIRFKSIDTFNIFDANTLMVGPDVLHRNIQNILQNLPNTKVKHNLDKILENEEINYRHPDSVCPCYSPWLEVYVQWYGGVRLCCEFYSSKYDMGNILKDNFKEIWNSQQMQCIRSNFIKGRVGFPVCMTCTRFQRNVDIYNRIQRIKRGHLL